MQHSPSSPRCAPNSSSPWLLQPGSMGLSTHRDYHWLISCSLWQSCYLHILLQRSSIQSILQKIKSLFLPSPSHPLPFAAFFPSSRPLLLLLPTPSFSIHISGGRLYERASAPFSAGQRPTSSPSALPYPPLLWLIQILLLVLRCSSFFRLKAMCHSLLLSLCLFLHLFLLLPPTQSLSPLPTTFSFVSVDVIVCKLLTVCASFCVC